MTGCDVVKVHEDGGVALATLGQGFASAGLVGVEEVIVGLVFFADAVAEDLEVFAVFGGNGDDVGQICFDSCDEGVVVGVEEDLPAGAVIDGEMFAGLRVDDGGGKEFIHG